jgi:hypothetical protein
LTCPRKRSSCRFSGSRPMRRSGGSGMLIFLGTSIAGYVWGATSLSVFGGRGARSACRWGASILSLSAIRRVVAEPLATLSRTLSSHLARTNRP